MELSVEQALHKAVEAHKAGRIQDAFKLYQAILQIEPRHPDANHNLGVIAASEKKLEAALNLFKTALEVNPNQGQFWVSYIDALVNDCQLENAKQVLELGKKSGLKGARIDNLSQQLAHINLEQDLESKSKNKKNKFPDSLQKKSISSPSKGELNRLISLFQKGQYAQAETLAKSIIKKYPKHQMSWKVLGGTLKIAGNLIDALVVIQESIRLLPTDAEAYSNLGVVQLELGKLNDAEKSFFKAIKLKPGYADAYSNLGVVQQQLGRLEDAELSYKKAISLKSGYVQAYFNLGIVQQELGKFEKAESSYRKAIALNTNDVKIHFNLGNLMNLVGNYDAAAVSFEFVLKLDPNHHSAAHLLAALRGKNPERATDSYVASLFDSYAEKFDSSLVDQLDYKTPAILSKQLRSFIPKEKPFWDILDLGCGTGLAGVELVDLAKTLVGVDLSEKMLALAKHRNIYHRLVKDEIQNALLVEQKSSFDVVVSSDVFVYIGDLAATFSCVYDVLRHGGFFAYSTEGLFPVNTEKATELPDYRLNITTRYSHALKYLNDLAKSNNYIVRDVKLERVRMERGQPVMGYVVVLQK